jgi:hypothetical protein
MAYTVEISVSDNHRVKTHHHCIIIVNVIVIAATTIGETDLFEPYPLLEDSARFVLN